MSVQFGRWNFDGKPVDRDYLEKVSPLIAPYGPDGAGAYSKGNISILYRPFHSTKESRRESQPHVASSGVILTWDGRLDNRAELIGQLGDPLYPRKLNALYHEFVETGVHEKLGYTSPADMVDRYPQFYWSKIERYIGDALRYLEMTMEGKQWTATLYSHIFAIEHNRRRMGPQPG